jgi:Lrp/AsnC family transcriptional regulator for asnA, asnC and gidA
MDSEVELDEIDVKILCALINDVRTKLKDMSTECGLTSNAIFKRIKRLKETGVIVGTTLYPDARKFGFTIVATVGINLDYTQEEDIIKVISGLAKMNLIELSPSIGKYDLTAFMLTKNIQELDRITQAIRKHPGVKRIAVNIWVSQPHFNFENLKLQPTRV